MSRGGRNSSSRGKLATAAAAAAAARKCGLSSQEQFCSYPHRTCMQSRIEGYEFCIRHILEDKTAPFKQCNYVFTKNGKRCSKAASKLERRDGYCMEHARKVFLARQKAIRKKKPPENAESLLMELDHYCERENAAESQPAKLTNHLGGFSGNFLLFPPQTSYINKILDYVSDHESESDKEPLAVERTWFGDCDSDTDSVDAEQEDPLKHAGVYTAEEIALITRDKLIRLQSLYIDQFKRLQHVLVEKRRIYLRDVKVERETLPSIHSMPRTTVEEENRYEKLKALLRYHKVHGVEAVLHSRAKERRRVVSDSDGFKPATVETCSHGDSEPKCNLPVLPLSKYCSKHILDDPQQLLFRPCQMNESGCKQPFVPVVNGQSCRLHATVAAFSLHNFLRSQQFLSVHDHAMAPSAMGSESETTCSAEEMDSHGTDSLYPHGSNADTANKLYQMDPEVQHIQDIIRQSEREVFSKLPDKPPEDFLSVSQHSPDTDVEK